MKYLGALAAVLAVAGLGWVVYQDSLGRTSPESTSEPPPAVSVEAMRVRQMPIEQEIELVGGLEAAAAVDVRARTSGYIADILVDVGDPVEAGQLLIELDDSQLRQQVEQAQAALQVAKAELRAKESQLQFARRELQRYERLAQSQAGTGQDLDQARSQLEIAEAEVELAQAQVAQAQAEFDTRKLDLEETQLVSPSAGYVAERYVEVGDLAQPSSSLVRIVRIDPVRTMVHVTEKDYEKVHVGQTALVSVDTFPNRTFPGEIRRKAPVLDPDTRTGLVQLEIDNPEGLLKPGMHARLSLTFARRDSASAIPTSALLQHTERPTVLVVTGDPPQAVQQEVAIGMQNGEVVEIVSGLEPGDLVVTLGARIIEHGQAVQPTELPWPNIGALAEAGPSNEDDNGVPLQSE